MALAAGLLTLQSISSNSAVLSSAPATGGTGAVTYQWYRSTTSGFTPGVGNILSGATSLNLNDSGLIPQTVYYWKVVATDSTLATATSSQVSGTSTPQQLSQNQFAQVSILGMIDLRFPLNSVSVQIDASQSGSLYAGAAVKMVDSADGTPKVIGCSANSDNVLGFINYDIKTVAFVAGSLAEISMGGNVIFLYATGAIARGAQVQLDISSPGCVAQAVASSGANIVGWAYDKAPAAGALIRVFLRTPSFTAA